MGSIVDADGVPSLLKVSGLGPNLVMDKVFREMFPDKDDKNVLVAQLREIAEHADTLEPEVLQAMLAAHKVATDPALLASLQPEVVQQTETGGDKKGSGAHAYNNTGWLAAAAMALFAMAQCRHDASLGEPIPKNDAPDAPPVANAEHQAHLDEPKMDWVRRQKGADSEPVRTFP